MSYHVIKNLGASGITAATQKITAIDTSLKSNQDLLSSLINKLSNINTTIKKLDPTKDSQYYNYLNKAKTSVEKAIDLLNPSADQRRLAKISSWSHLEDTIAILGVIALFGSMIILAFITKDSRVKSILK